MKELLQRTAKAGAPFGVLAIGIGGLSVMFLLAPTAEVLPNFESDPIVRVYEIEPRTHQVTVTAHGTSRAGQTWDPVAEVDGRISARSPKFEAGELLRAGTVVLQIDDALYRSAVDQIDAQIHLEQIQEEHATESLQSLNTRIINTERQVAITRDQYETVLGLAAQGIESGREAELLEQQLIGETNQLNVLIEQRIDLQKELARVVARTESLQKQRMDASIRLDKTTITIPFDGICSARHVDVNRFVAVGAPLGEFVSIDRAEIEVFLEADAKELYESEELASLRFNVLQIDELIDRSMMELPVRVKVLSHPDTVYDGLVKRARFVDPTSRTIPVLIEVKDPFAVIGLDHPALSPNLFCEVQIFGRHIENAFVIPREAIRDDSVFVSRDGQLVIVELQDPLIQDDVVVIESGIEPGDQVVLSEVYPAVPGMKLRTQIVDDPTLP